MNSDWIITIVVSVLYVIGMIVLYRLLIPKEDKQNEDIFINR